jgi:hypothetical protein
MFSCTFVILLPDVVIVLLVLLSVVIQLRIVSCDEKSI